MAWSTRCRKSRYGPSSRTSRPAAARASAASSRRATSVFHAIPGAPPGRSAFAHAGAAAPQQFERAPGEGRRRLWSAARRPRRGCRAGRRTAGRPPPGPPTPAGRTRRPGSCPPRRPQGAGLAGLVLVLGRRELRGQPPGHDLAVAPHRGEVRLVLQPLVLQPALDEHGVGLDVARVDVRPEGVEPVHQRLVERGAAAAQRVEDGKPPRVQIPAKAEDASVTLSSSLVNCSLVFRGT